MSDYTNAIVKHTYGDLLHLDTATAITGTWSSLSGINQVTEDASSGAATTELSVGSIVIIDNVTYEVEAITDDNTFTRSSEKHTPILPVISSKTVNVINTGLDSNLSKLDDGTGTESPVSISTTDVEVDGDLTVTGQITVGDNTDIDISRYDDGSNIWLSVNNGDGSGGDGRLVSNRLMVGGTGGAQFRLNGTIIEVRNNADNALGVFRANFLDATSGMSVGSSGIYRIGNTVRLQPTAAFPAAGTSVESSGIFTNSSSLGTAFSVVPTVNSSGTASNTDFLVNRTETATGSGNQYLLDLQVDGSTKFNVDNSGIVTFSNYTRHIDIPPGAAVLGPTAPSKAVYGTFEVLCFDSNSEKAYIEFEVPDDWVGTDMKLKIYWTNESGTAIADTETVIFKADYRSIDMDSNELWDNGTVAAKSVTYTQSGAGTDKETRESEITLPYNDANQPLTAGDVVGIEFYRDFTTDTYGSDACIFRWEIEFTSNKLPEH